MRDCRKYMERIKLFEESGLPKKMTRARLQGVLEELGLTYSIQERGKETDGFRIVIDLPQEHVEEKQERIRGNVLNQPLHTSFDNEKMLPLIRAIKRSRNFGCEIVNTELVAK